MSSHNSTHQNTLILRNLPYHGTYAIDLLEIFDYHGEITGINIIRNRDYSCKGYGFISFDNSEQATKALAALPDFRYEGRKVKVEYARPKTKPKNNC